jgi:hypothetical protein
MGAITNTSVPEAPDNHTLNTFSQHFTSAGEINALLKGNTHSLVYVFHMLNFQPGLK